MEKRKGKRRNKKEKPYYPEQLAAANELNLDPNKDKILMKLAHDMCRPESMPSTWHAYLDEEKNRRYYYNVETGLSQWDHPLIGYYRGAIFMERGGYSELLERDQAKPPTEEEITGMASYFGIKPSESSYILEVARMAVSAPLPSGWDEIEEEIEVNGQLSRIVAYRNAVTGEKKAMHPLDHYFIELRDRRRKELRKRAKAMNAVAAVSAMSELAAKSKDTASKEEMDAEEGNPESSGTVGASSRPRRGRPSIMIGKRASTVLSVDDLQEAVKEAVQEPVKEPAKEPAKDTVQEPDVESPREENTQPLELVQKQESTQSESNSLPHPSTEIVLCMKASEVSAWDVDPQLSTMQLKHGVHKRGHEAAFQDYGYLESRPASSFEGTIHEEEDIRDVFDEHIRHLVDSVASCQCQSLTILGWGHASTGKHTSLFGDEQKEGLASLVYNALSTHDNKKSPKMDSVKALFLTSKDHKARDLIKGKDFEPYTSGPGVDLETALVDQGIHVERVKNMKALKAFIKKASSKGPSDGNLILTLKVEFRGAGKGTPGWIHFVEVSGIEGNENPQSGAISEDLVQQTEIITGMLSAKLLKGGGGFLPYKKSFMLQLAGCNGSKGGQMIILPHVNTALEHVEGTSCVLSLTTRLTQAIQTANKVMHQEGEGGEMLVHSTACLEVLKTLLSNLRERNHDKTNTLMCFRKLTEDLCKCIESLNGMEPMDKVLTALLDKIREQDNGFEKHDRDVFEEIIGHIRILAAGGEGKDAQLQAYVSRANELSQELDRCTIRKEELKKTLAEYEENTNEGSNKLGNYAKQLEDMREKMKILKETDQEKEEQLEIFQAELRHLRSSLEHQDELMSKMRMYEEEISKLSTDLQRITGSEGHHIERSETLEAQTNELMAKVQELSTKDEESKKLISELSTQLKASLKKLEEQAVDARKAKEKCNHLSNSLHELQEANHKLSAHLVQCKKREESLEEEMGNAESTNSKHKSMAEKYKADAAALKEEVERLQSIEKAKDGALEKSKDVNEKLVSLEKKLAVLLEEKSILLDRLEGLTGEAQGDVCDDMPPAPPGLTVPPVDVKCAQNISPELALSSIVRVVRIARPATKGSRTLSDDIEPGPVNPWHAVEVVRELRSERNELRRRDRLGREEISQLRKRLKVAEDSVETTSELELQELSAELGRAVGTSPPSNLSAVEGLKSGIEATSALKDDSFLLKRQYASLALILKQEERKVSSKEKEIRALKKAASGDGDINKPDCSWEKEKASLESEREDLKERLKELLALGSSKGDPIHFDALRQKEDVRIQLQRTEARLRAVEKDRDRWKQLSQQKALNREKRAHETSELFKWKSSPMAPVEDMGGKKTLPPLTTERGGSPVLGEGAGKIKRCFDTRPIPVEVKKRVQRMEDRIMKEPVLAKAKTVDEKGFDPLLTGDPRDAEIAGLKVRLVRAEMDRSEIASRAAAERREAHLKIQTATRSIEEAQHIADQVQTTVVDTLCSQESQELVRYASQVLDDLFKKTERLQIT